MSSYGAKHNTFLPLFGYTQFDSEVTHINTRYRAINYTWDIQ